MSSSVTNRKVQKYEKFSKAQRVIITEHAKVHDGDAYTASTITTSNAIAANGIFDILLFNPSSFSFPHLRIYEWDAEEAPANITLCESVTVANTGTSFPVFNLNRSSTNVSSISTFHTSSVSATGLCLESHVISGAKKIGGSTENATIEWILKPATNYLFRIENNSSNPTDIGFFAFWYE